jgi:hypothetical protein
MYFCYRWASIDVEIPYVVVCIFSTIVAFKVCAGALSARRLTTTTTTDLARETVRKQRRIRLKSPQVRPENGGTKHSELGSGLVREGR